MKSYVDEKRYTILLKINAPEACFIYNSYSGRKFAHTLNFLLVVQNASCACTEDEWTNKHVGGAKTLSSKTPPIPAG